MLLRNPNRSSDLQSTLLFMASMVHSWKALLCDEMLPTLDNLRNFFLSPRRLGAAWRISPTLLNPAEQLVN